MDFPKALFLIAVAVMLSSCAKMTEIQPNNKLLPGYSTENHDNRVSLNRPLRAGNLLAAEWYRDDIVVLVVSDAYNEKNPTRDSIAWEFYSLETGEEVNFAAERTQTIKDEVWKSHLYKREKVPEDEQKTDDLFVQVGDEYAGADYVSKVVYYSRNEDYSLDERQKVEWKWGSYTGSGPTIKVSDGDEEEQKNYGKRVNRDRRWAVDLHPSGRYLRIEDKIYDRQTEARYKLQKGYRTAYYAFSPSWDRLLVLHTKGLRLSADIVEFDVDNLTNESATDSKNAEGKR